MSWYIENIDEATLMIVSVVLHLLAAAMLLMLAWCKAHARALRLWAYGDLLYAGGFITFLSSYALPDGAVTAANLLIDLGTAAAYLGVLSFLDRPRRDRWPIALAALLWIGEIAWYLSNGLDLRETIIVGCTLRAVLMIAAGWQLLRRAPNDIRLAASVTAICYLMWVALLLSRVAWWIFAIGLAEPGTDDPTTGPALLVRIALTFVIAPSYFWMVSRRLDAELIRLAHQDSLTGIANRRVLWETAEIDVARALRQDRTLGVLMIDIDHFKQVNDRWGHGAGDALLVAVAGQLAGAVRSADLLARIGGEEFAALLPDAGLDETRIVAERARQTIERLVLPRPDGTEVRCTISIGIAILGRDGGQWEQLISAADEALYRAKRHGRNRIEAAVLATG